MASTANSVDFSSVLTAMPQVHHRPAFGVVHHPSSYPSSHPAAQPYEHIVDFTHSSAFVSQSHMSDMTVQHQHQHQQSPPVHRLDATEWKQPSFYPYRPNEVKHRKRTTRHQLKVLEETFRTTQKPDGNVRKSLALQLDMTPRNVQVWFQNRRAKDKTLAKRALKQTEEGKVKEGGVEATAQESFSVTSPIESASSIAVSPKHMHSGSTSPAEAVFNQHAELSSAEIAQPQPLSHTISPLTSPLRSEVMPFQSPTSYTTTTSFSDAPTAPSVYTRDIYAPRGSLPHIPVSPFSQDIQHQRSNSSPAFLTNVDTTSTLSLTNYTSVPGGVLYPQRLGSSMYHSSFPSSVACVPPGPLPRSDFVFGATRSSLANEADKDKEYASYAHYSHFSSMSGSDTPSSLSHYGSVASLADSDVASFCSRAYDDEMGSGSLGWQRDQRRGSNGYLSQTLDSRGISPVGHINGSPRSGHTPSEAEVELPEGALYIPARPNWETTTTNMETKSLGYQLYQSGSDGDSSDVTPPANPYQSVYAMPSYDQNTSMGVYNAVPTGYAPVPVAGYHYV